MRITVNYSGIYKLSWQAYPVHDVSPSLHGDTLKYGDGRIDYIIEGGDAVIGTDPPFTAYRYAWCTVITLSGPTVIRRHSARRLSLAKVVLCKRTQLINLLRRKRMYQKRTHSREQPIKFQNIRIFRDYEF